MDLDLTGLWTWTVPLWGLGALVLFLVAIMNSPVNIITTGNGIELMSAATGMTGGGRRRSVKSSV